MSNIYRALRGFDLCDFGGSRIQFNVTETAGHILTGTIGPGLVGGGGALFLNSISGEFNYTQLFDAQSAWGYHVHFQYSQVGHSDGSLNDWFRILSGSTILLSLRITIAGKLQICGPGGAIIATSAAPLATATTYEIECVAAFGTSGHVKVLVNQSNVFAGGPTFSANFGAALPDTVTMARCEGNGVVMTWFDNVTVYNGSDFDGPCQITSLAVTADAPTIWTPSTGATCTGVCADIPGVAIASPDGDTTYMTPGTSPQYFLIEKSPCFGRVLAVAENVSAKANSGSQTMAMLWRPLATPDTIGAPVLYYPGPLSSPAAPNYFTYQSLIQTSPVTGGAITDAEISNGEWAVDSTGDIRVTQVYIEKLTTTQPLSYNCGGGNYSF